MSNVDESKNKGKFARRGVPINKYPTALLTSCAISAGQQTIVMCDQVCNFQYDKTGNSRCLPTYLNFFKSITGQQKKFPA